MTNRSLRRRRLGSLLTKKLEPTRSVKSRVLRVFFSSRRATQPIARPAVHKIPQAAAGWIRAPLDLPAVSGELPGSAASHSQRSHVSPFSPLATRHPF